ncbi:MULTISPECIES: hypothetical protein [Flavobacterium]|uniref:hypothetical protein n=1 Tax=Flavobacterium TaxID=237 RepID=UPI0011826DC6|nr:MULTISPECIES: hypothetical protein [Flavobacterium]MCR4033195.1 hypothetical protein [Flavobacterium panacis]
MKKTALTIGLFSLVMVATSFANPEFSNNSSTSLLKIDPPVNGQGMTGGTKKRDVVANNELMSRNDQTNFASINQSVGGNKKMD